MATRDDRESEKFTLDSWNVNVLAVEGVAPATAILLDTPIDDLESNKFTSDWKIRVITTF